MQMSLLPHLKRSKVSIVKRLTAVCVIGVAALYSITTTADVSVRHADADKYIRWIQASHFLSQATMGPTVATTTALADRIQAIGRDNAFNEWIDDQFRMDPWHSETLAYKMVDRDGVERGTSNIGHPTLEQSPRYYREHAWWHQTLYSEGQLRERMTWALYQILPAYGRDATIGWWANLAYMDLLKDNAFGNHRDLLEDVTYSPMMGNFLSSLKNDKGDESAGIFPDENYAREVMQLFSVGIYRIDNNARFVTDGNGNRVENYTNEDITQIARVFTGLGNSKAHERQNFFSASQTGERMIMWEDHHHQGTKTFLGRSLPANQSGDQDIADTLDILINHGSTPYFFSNLLIQRLTSSTPNVNYLKRVGEVYKDNGQGVRGDFKEVIRAILMDPTVRDSLTISKTVDPSDNTKTLINVDVNLELWENDNTQGRLREPMLQLANFLRFLDADAKEHEAGLHRGDFKPIWSELSVGQGIRDTISIFGYYSADFLPVTGPAANKTRNQRPLVLPEFELLPTFAVRLNEKIQSIVNRGTVEQRHTTTSPNTQLPRLEQYLGNNTFAELIQELNIFLFAGTMSKRLQDDLVVALDDVSGRTDLERLSKAIAVLLSSADFAVTN